MSDMAIPAAFNLLVRINYGHPVACCEMLSHAGLSSTHEANENQVISPALPCLFLLQVIFNHLLCQLYGPTVHPDLWIPKFIGNHTLI